MVKFVVLLAIVVLSVSCMTNKEVKLTDKKEEYFDFHLMCIVYDKPKGRNALYLEGVNEDGRFTPIGNITGQIKEEVKGEYGWLEIPSGKFFAMQTSIAPTSPYVRGYMTRYGFPPLSAVVE